MTPGGEGRGLVDKTVLGLLRREREVCVARYLMVVLCCEEKVDTDRQTTIPTGEVQGTRRFSVYVRLCGAPIEPVLNMPYRFHARPYHRPAAQGELAYYCVIG